MVRLLPELHLGELAMIPAVGHDAVIGGRFAGEVIRLRSAGDRREGGINERGVSRLQIGADPRGMVTDETPGQPDDVEDNRAIHP